MFIKSMLTVLIAAIIFVAGCDNQSNEKGNGSIEQAKDKSAELSDSAKETWNDWMLGVKYGC